MLGLRTQKAMSDSDRPTRSRRNFLQKTTLTATLATLGTSSPVTGETQENPQLKTDPFTLGVASGDPLPDSVVLWTRIAPEPLKANGGMPDRSVAVQWKLGRSTKNGKVHRAVQADVVAASPETAHSVHVEPEGLDPDTEYYYQFKIGPYRSPIGRTKTAPDADEDINKLDFAFVSCQRYPAGYYTSHHHLAQEDLDVAFHLGDYIYEDGGQGSLGRGHQPPRECKSLSDYRIRHAQYKTDENLQASHAAFPWIVTWDDHEVVNNYADEDDSVPPEEFLKRRTAAYQAYWEHQPLRESRLPDGPDMPLYRRFTFGEMAEFNILDTRQYRDDQPDSTDEADNPNRTILGENQEQWLVDGLDSSSSRWNVLANQVPFTARDTNLNPEKAEFGNGEKWDGYQAERNRILEFMAERPSLNPVVITGDVHNNAVYDLKADFSDPDSETVGTEYIGTSVSSSGDANVQTSYGSTFEPRVNSPWRKFWNNNRGYVRCTLTADDCRTDYRVVSTVEDTTASVNTLASFRTEDGTPGAKQTTASIDIEVPPAYEATDDSSESFEATVTFLNPGGPDVADVTMEDVELEIVSLPDHWSKSATTQTSFETVANGEFVTVTWEVTPDATPDRDVELKFETTYEIEGKRYQHIFEKELSENQIAYWRFENSTADSSSYDHPFTLGNGAGFDDQIAIEGDYSLLLDGDDDYIRISGDEFLTDAFSTRSVSMWIYPDSTTGIQDLFTEGGSKNGLALRINNDTLEAGVASDFNLVTVDAPFAQTDWAHVAVVFDEGALRLYINGSEVASTPDVGFDTVPNHGSEGAIGRAGGGSYAFIGTGENFGGRVDATSIYSGALSGDEILALSDRKQRTANIDFQVPEVYDATEPFELTAQFTNPEGPDAADVTMENVALNILSAPESWSIHNVTQSAFETVANGESVTVTWEVTPAATGDVELTLGTTYEIEGESYRQTSSKQAGEGRIAYWRFENSTADSSSYDHPFTLGHGAGFDSQVAIEGKYSLGLDGTDDYIRISNGDFLSDAFSTRSVSMWINPDSTTGIQDLFTEGGSKNGLAIRINDGSLEAGVANDFNLASITAPFTQTDWTHVAVVFDEGALRLYVDGSEVASTADVGFEIIPSHGSEGAIGRAGDGSYVWEGTHENFGGYVDSTGIYRNALSTEEISAIANEF